MSHHIVEAQGVHFSYPDGHRAVNGVSFKIMHGESVGIIGANGAGKSTLLMLLTGILFPGEGTVAIGHTRITEKNVNSIRRRIGMIFQDPDDQLFMPTVYDDVAFGPRNFNLTEEQVKAQVSQALAATGTAHLAQRSPFKLSAGEKRSAALASVLSMLPDILVLDEPSSFLDPAARRRLINLLGGFTHTKIITSHDLDMVLELCSRVILVSRGTVAADGPTREILTDRELMARCGLELPLSLQSCPVCGSKKGSS